MTDPGTPLIARGDVTAALALLTRLPVRLPVRDSGRGAAGAWAYPLAGLAVGAIAAATGLLATWLGLPTGVAAGLILAASVAVTGALHEDGLADACDGLWGGWDRAQRLAIMRDSRIGAYGVIALILALGLRWTALGALIASGHFAAPVLAAAALSRAPMVALMHALPPARDTGLSHDTGRPSRATAGLAAGLALGIGLLLIGFSVIPVAFTVALTGLAAAALARAKIGGQTGDILGATQQVSEIAALVTLAALFA